MANSEVNVTGSSLIFFFFITLGFTIFTLISIQNAKTIPAIEKAKDGSLLTIIYVIIVIIGSYFINTSVSKALCNSQSIRWNSILMATLLPWTIIFFSLFVILKVFPGWITPFSNTVGYLVISILGVETTLTKILNTTTDDHDVDLKKALANISHNKSNFINQIDIDVTDFKSFIQKLIDSNIIVLKKDEEPSNLGVPANTQRSVESYVGGGGLEESERETISSIRTSIRAGAGAGAGAVAVAGAEKSTNENNPDIQDLYRLLVIKNTIGKITWYILAGVLVSSISDNYIINMSCEKSLEEIQKDLDNAEAKSAEYIENNQ
jgi:hypothetical protein